MLFSLIRCMKQSLIEAKLNIMKNKKKQENERKEEKRKEWKDELSSRGLLWNSISIKRSSGLILVGFISEILSKFCFKYPSFERII